jgi:hypothetical protein
MVIADGQVECKEYPQKEKTQTLRQQLQLCVVPDKL